MEDKKMEVVEKAPENFMDRLLREETELNEKISKLTIFINSDKFKEVDSVQQSLLKVQVRIMESYSCCLDERIKQINNK